MIGLKKPCKEYEKEVFDYKKEMIENGNSDLNGCGSLERFDCIEDWISHIDSYSNKFTITDKKYVEGSQWLLMDFDNNRILGMVNIRHELNDYLLNFGGHIGYSIRPSERRKGYAKIQLREALNVLKEKGVKQALITCDDTNIGSFKTIESCGGILENKVNTEDGITRRYWINL